MGVRLSTVRIVGGTWRSRRIQFPNTKDLRPTPDRVRETVFNWLQFDIAGANCLDAFAGSGALGFEALSRGASAVTFIDPEPLVITAINHNATLFKAEDRVHALCHSALDYLNQTPPQAYDIIFCDPPYSQNLLAPFLQALTQGWLKPQARLYIEQGQAFDTLIDTQHFDLLKMKKTGQVYYGLLKFKALSQHAS